MGLKGHAGATGIGLPGQKGDRGKRITHEPYTC